MVRLDRALRADLRRALRSRAIVLFLLIEVAAAAVFVARRGSETIATILLIWLGMLILAFFAWWAGRHSLAHPAPDAVPGATARAAFALLAASGMAVAGSGASLGLGFVLVACGAGGWIWAAWRHGGLTGLRGRLLRDPRPFVPLLLLIGLPRLLVGGPAFIPAAILALPSGVGQQLLYLLGLFAPLEALRRRTDVAAVAAALVFAVIHLPLVIEANGHDIAASLANVVLFQASVAIIACLAFVRHRAAVPLGVAHAMAIA